MFTAKIIIVFCVLFVAVAYFASRKLCVTSPSDPDWAIALVLGLFAAVSIIIGIGAMLFILIKS